MGTSTPPTRKGVHTLEELEDAQYDPAKRGEVLLDELLDEEEDEAEAIIRRELSQTSVEEERHAKHVLKEDTGRTMSRVLFITRDASYLEPESTAMTTMLSLGALFDEIHVMVLLPLGNKEKNERRADNVWIYRASAQFWWLLPFAAVDKAKEQLAFSEGFRPDIIVGLDPFESGLAALKIAHTFDRAVQVHVPSNFYTTDFAKRKGSFWRKKLATYVLKRAKSVRTTTSATKDVLGSKFKKIPDLRVLPQFHNFSALHRAKPRFDIHDKYKDYVFIALAFGPLSADSNLHDVFSALNATLHNPRIGLVVVGSGPAKHLFEEKAELLGITKNVVFLSELEDEVSYLKTADVLIQTGTSHESEEIVLKAAAAGLPLIMYATELREDLFEDGKSAGICEQGDVYGLMQNITAFLNNQALRIQYKDAAQHIVTTRLDEDEASYFRAYRDSIERALVEGEEPTQKPETGQETKEVQEETKEDADPSFEPALEMKYPENR